jgi:hypothetical protein
MSIGNVMWICLFVASILAISVSYKLGVLEGGNCVIRQLMQKGTVNIVHTDDNTKVVWEVDVSDEKLENKQ